MILLSFLVVLTLVCTFLLFQKDRKFLKKNVREAVSEETKKYLNLPVSDAAFRETLSEKRLSPKLSRRILDEMNKRA